MIATAFMLAILVVVGVVSGHFFSAQLTGSTRAATLAFATAALLYLAVEELLVEGPTSKKTPASRPDSSLSAFYLSLFCNVFWAAKLLPHQRAGCGRGAVAAAVGGLAVAGNAVLGGGGRASPDAVALAVYRFKSPYTF